jgi:type I restriction enzyme, S subunit
VDQGQDFIGGFSNDDDNLVEGNGPWIVFGDHTRVLKYVDFRFCMGADGVKVLKPRADVVIDAKYLFHFLTANEIPSAGYSRHYKFLKRLEIPLPLLDEQQRIAAILDKADTLHRKRKRTFELLDGLTQAIFLEMFGDPVRNDKGWEIRSLGDISTSRLGKMLDQKKVKGLVAYPYLANLNVQWDYFDLSSLRQMGFSDEDREEFKLVPGDLLVCEGGEIGRSAIWRGEVANCFYQKALHRVRCDRECCTPEYLLWYFWFMAQGGGLSAHTSMATIAHLTGVKLKALPVPLPPLKLQAAFSATVLKAKDERLKLQSAGEHLEALFSSLQHRAFSGQL